MATTVPEADNLVETCLIDEGNGVQYDLLELDQDGELNGSDDLEEEEEEEESSSDEVHVEINDLVPPSINTSTDKQDSGIDDKDSSPPTQPASPKDESTFDVRAKLARGTVTEQQIKDKTEARKRRTAEIKKREQRKRNEKALQTNKNGGNKTRKKPDNNRRRSAPPPPVNINKPAGGQRMIRRTLDNTWMETSKSSSPPKRNNNSPKNKKQKKKNTRPNNKMNSFENFRVTVSPGKTQRLVSSVEQEEKKVASEVLLGLINPAKQSLNTSDASRAILSMLNPYHVRTSPPPKTATEILFGVRHLPPPPPVPTRLTLDSTWALFGNEENKENNATDTLSDKFGRISPFGQKKPSSMASKFNEWKKRQTLDTTWQGF